LRRARLLVGLTMFGMMAIIGVLALLQDTLTCARSGQMAGSCRWQGGVLGNRQRVFPLASLREVRVERTQTSNKGRTTRWGAVALQIGKRELVMLRESESLAEAHVAALQAFLASQDAPEIRLETERSPAWLIPLAFFALAGFGLLYSVWAGRRRFRCTFNGLAQQLIVQAEWPLGIAVGAPRTVELRNPLEVEVEWGNAATDFFTPARMPGPRGGRLRVRLKDGQEIWLDEKRWPGYRVHIAAAEELRMLLGCPLRTTAQADRVAAEHEAARPRPAATWTSFGGKVATAWLGVCCGSLLGIFAGAIGAITIGGQKASDSADGPFFFGGMFLGMFAGVALAWRFTQRGDER
jgi:hypothetical protein